MNFGTDTPTIVKKILLLLLMCYSLPNLAVLCLFLGRHRGHQCFGKQPVHWRSVLHSFLQLYSCTVLYSSIQCTILHSMTCTILYSDVRWKTGAGPHLYTVQSCTLVHCTVYSPVHLYTVQCTGLYTCTLYNVKFCKVVLGVGHWPDQGQEYKHSWAGGGGGGGG